MIETLDDCVGRVVAKLDALGPGGEHHHHLHVGQRRPARAGNAAHAGDVQSPVPGRQGLSLRRRRARAADRALARQDQGRARPPMCRSSAPTGRRRCLALAKRCRSKEKFDGVNLADLLLHGKAPPARPLFWHQPHYTNQGGRPAGAIRDGNWKLIEHYENGACELYDLAKDLGEDDRSRRQGAGPRRRPARQARKVAARRRRPGKHRQPEIQRRSSGSNCITTVDRLELARSKTKAATMAPKLEPWRALMNDVMTDPKKNAEPKVPWRRRRHPARPRRQGHRHEASL